MCFSVCVCVFVHASKVRRFKQDGKGKEVKLTHGQMHKQINIRRMGTERRGRETKSDRWRDEKVEEKEDNWRNKQVGRGEREERHGSQSADTFKQLVPCRVLRDTSTQSLYTWKGEMFKCHCDLFSAPSLPHPRPQHPSTQSTYLQKQKGNM